MVLNKNILALYFLLFFVTISFSQEIKEATSDSLSGHELEEVIITATRSLRQVSSLPLPASLISKKEMEHSNSVRLSDILNEQTGLITVPDFGGGEGIQMQGLDSQYTLILIDGVPLVGRSAGTLDLNRITVGNIRQIEIVKGASSGLYGNEALGGVINIITETPKNGFNGTASYRPGSFNTHDLSTSLNYKKEKLGITGFVNGYSSDGYNLSDSEILNTVEPFENFTLSTKVNYAFNDNTAISLSGRYFYQNQKVVATETLSGESDIDEWNTHFKADHKFSEKWNAYLEMYLTNYKTTEYLDNTDGTRFNDNFYNQWFVRPEMRLVYRPKNKNEFTGGVGFTRETLDRTNFSESPEFNSPYAFVQYDTHLSEKLNLILGARFDSHNEYQSQLSPKAALRYEFNDKFSIKSSVGYGFKAPDFRQLYFDFTNSTVGYTVLGYNAVPEALARLVEQGQIANIIVPVSEFDEQLKAESSLSINIGTDYKVSNNLKFSLNIFRNNISNLIDTRIIANKTNGQNVFSYFNVDEVYTQGVEFNTQWKPLEQLTVSGGYQLLYAKDKTAEEAFENGEVFARERPASPAFQLEKEDYFGLFNRSRHMANLKLFYEVPKWKMDTNLRTTFRSKYGLFDNNGNGYLDTFDDFVDGYAIVDFAINKTLFENYKLGVGVDNVFGFTDPQNISNIPGSLYYGKLLINF